LAEHAHITILVADSSFERLNATSKRLKQEGYQVLAATGDKQAIAMAMNKRPDIVILEATLEGSISVTSREIKKFNSVHATKLVIKGEVIDDVELNELSNLDIQDFIPYTVGLEELVGRIKRVEAGKPQMESFKTTELITGKRKILLVEDDYMNQRYIGALLENMGYDTEVCTDGQEAFEKIKHNSYDLVITDLNVPGLSGIELTKEIRAAYSTELPVIGISGHAEQSRIKQCLDIGMNDYLIKPFETARLADVLQKYLKQPINRQSANSRVPMAKYDYSQLLNVCEGNNQLLPKLMEGYLELVRKSITVLSDSINTQTSADDQKIFHSLLNQAVYFGAEDLSLFIKELSEVRNHNPKQEIIIRFYKKIMAELNELETFYCEALDNVKHGKLL
jgi:CheY-like chemotaxis protein